MITAKRILCGILLCGLLLSLLSCQQKNTEYPFESLGDGEANVVSQYRIILPAACSAALYERAEALSRLLSEKVGATVTVRFDYDPILKYDVPELLLGYTARPLSVELLGSLKRDDYICRADGKGGAVIGGITDEATVVAIDRFCEEILPAATAECLMNEHAGFTFLGEYSVTQVLLNGFDLGCYCLVYPHGADDGTKALVEKFRNRLTERSGYVLEVCSDRKIMGREKMIRLVTATESGSETPVYIEPVSSGIEIRGGGRFGFSMGLSELEALLFSDGEQGLLRCDIESVRSIPYEQETYRLGTLLTGGGAWISTPSKLADALSHVWDRLPDGLFLDSMDEMSQGRIRDSLYSSYRTISLHSEEMPSAYSKGEGFVAISREQAWEGGPMTEVYRVGSEKYGFYLLWVSGAVTCDGELRLPETLSDATLPVVVMIHVEEGGGSFSVSDESFVGMRMHHSEEGSAESSPYLFRCYGTDGALDVTIDVQERGSRYREITVKRSSVYP